MLRGWKVEKWRTITLSVDRKFFEEENKRQGSYLQRFANILVSLTASLSRDKGNEG